VWVWRPLGAGARKCARRSQDLSRDQRARNSSRHRDLEPGRLNSIVLVVAGPQRRLPDRRRPDGGPLEVALIPVRSLYRDMGSSPVDPFGNHTGVVIFHVAFGLPFGVFLMRNFFIGLPTALIDPDRPVPRMDVFRRRRHSLRYRQPPASWPSSSSYGSGTTFSWRSLSSRRPQRTAHLVPIRPGTDPGSPNF